MKKIIYVTGVIVAMLFSSTVFAKHYNSKSEYKTLHHSFHHAKNVHRFDKSNGITEYDFLVKGKYVSALFDQTGNLIETDYSIAFQELPARAQEYINSEFATAPIIDIEKVVHKQNTFYKIRLESDGNEYSIVVTSSGQVTVGY